MDVGIIGVCNSFFIPADESGSEMAETLWFNSYRRIVCFAGEEWFIFDEESGIPAAIIYSLAIDKEFRLWVGTGEHGLLQSAGPISLNSLKKLKREREGGVVAEKLFKPALDSLDNAALSEVSEIICPGDSLWIGTPRGLYIIDRHTFALAAHFSKLNGLRNNNIVCMDISRDRNSVCVGSNEGLAEIDMRNPRVLRTVTREDGLLSNETAWLESLKAGENGFVYFEPRRD